MAGSYRSPLSTSNNDIPFGLDSHAIIKRPPNAFLIRLPLQHHAWPVLEIAIHTHSGALAGPPRPFGYRWPSTCHPQTRGFLSARLFLRDARRNKESLDSMTSIITSADARFFSDVSSPSITLHVTSSHAKEVIATRRIKHMPRNLRPGAAEYQSRLSFPMRDMACTITTPCLVIRISTW